MLCKILLMHLFLWGFFLLFCLAFFSTFFFFFFFFSLDMFTHENLLRWKIFINRMLEKQPQERVTEFGCDFAWLDLQVVVSSRMGNGRLEFIIECN